MAEYPEGNHLKNVCKVRSAGECCRYLAPYDSKLWSCEKLSPLKSSIDEQVKKGAQIARGDNCKGLDWR